jgi:hypothetical protein
MLTRPQPDAARTDPRRTRRFAWLQRGLRAAILAGVLVASVLAPRPAQAADGAAQLQCGPAPANQPCTNPPGPVSSFGDSSPPCNDNEQAASSDCGTDNGRPGLDGCLYKLTEPTPATAAALANGADDPDGVWYIRTCGHGPQHHSTLVQLAAPPADDPATLAQHARLTLHLLQPVATVHSGSDPVGRPTWLWLAGEGWTPVSGTASASGQTTTVTATPSLAVWQTGDGLAELCTGPGTPWPAGTDPTQPSPDCGHLYAQPPDDPITVTVLWTLTADNDGTHLQLPPLTTTGAIIPAAAASDPPTPEATP